MFILRRFLALFYLYLLCQHVRAERDYVQVEMNASEEIAVAGKIIDDSWPDSSLEFGNGTLTNCTVLMVNGTNLTVCGNDTTVRKDQFKILPFLAPLIPILLKIAMIAMKIAHIIMKIAHVIWKIGVAIAKVVGKFAFKALTYAIRAGKMLGKYIWKAGKIIMDVADVAMQVYDAVDPVIQYYQAQEEAKRLAAEDQRLRDEDAASNRDVWSKLAANDVPHGVGEEPMWEPQRRPSILLGDEEENGMPGYVISMIVITLTALIVAMPTAAFILTARRKRHRRRRAASTTKKSGTKRITKSARPGSASRKTSKGKKTQGK